MLDYDIFLSYAFPILGIVLIVIPTCIGLAFLIGYIVEKNNVKKGLDKSDTNSTVGKVSLIIILALGSLAFVGVIILFVIGTLLGWETPI